MGQQLFGDLDAGGHAGLIVVGDNDVDHRVPITRPDTPGAGRLHRHHEQAGLARMFRPVVVHGHQLEVAAPEQRGRHEAMHVGCHAGAQCQVDRQRGVVAQSVAHATGLDAGGHQEEWRPDGTGGEHDVVRLDLGPVGELHADRPVPVERHTNHRRLGPHGDG